MKPRTLKAAIESGMIIDTIKQMKNGRCLVTVKTRFFNGRYPDISFDLTRKYIARNYPYNYENQFYY
jgi:hypothetical protein